MRVGCGVLLALCLLPSVAQADEQQPLEVSFGVLRTEAEAAAVRLAMDYAKDLDEVWVARYTPGQDRQWLLDLSPEVKINTGDHDAFDGIVAKVTGNYIRFRTTKVGGIVTPDSAALFHVIPVSVGIETARRLEHVNALAEFGYVPFRLGGKKLRVGINPKIGVFAQAGYKSVVKEGGAEQRGAEPGADGSVDTSQEKPDTVLARVKGQLGFELPVLTMSGGAQGVHVVATTTGWYDIMNDAWYYRIEATLRLKVADDKSFDFTYEKGSGAPNFNAGDQFSANLTMGF